MLGSVLWGGPAVHGWLPPGGGQSSGAAAAAAAVSSLCRLAIGCLLPLLLLFTQQMP